MSRSEFHWRTGFSASALHAAAAVDEGRSLADPRLAAALAEPAQQLAEAIHGNRLPAASVWRQLTALSATVGSNQQLAETALAKAVGRSARFDLLAPQFTRAIAALENALRQALPKLEDELTLRLGPLRQQWEARGPGLLHRLGQLTEENVVPPRVEVVVVQPVLGGGGRAHLAFNAVTIEGVLANPHHELPEVVRLGWLAAQLQADLPVYSENIHADRLEHIAAFATLVPILMAADEVELVHYSPDLVRRAMEAWDLVVPEGVDGAALVLDWWSTYFDTRPDWGVALTALDQMFG